MAGRDDKFASEQDIDELKTTLEQRLVEIRDALTPTSPGAHAPTHENGGADELDLTGLSGLLADPQAALSHASSHENGGGDEISVAGLSGLLADAQTPIAHASSHENGGLDELDVAGLSGVLADAQNPVQATESLVGGAEIATQAETDAGTDDTRLVTPLKLANYSKLIIPYVRIEDQRTQNTQGGTHTAGSWQTRVLNTIVSDDAGLVVSLNSNLVELAPGDWLILVSAPANSIGRSQIRLQDLTAGAPGTQLKAGTSEATSGAGADTTRSFLGHRLSFSQNKKFSVQMQGAATVATLGFGSAANFTTEVYTVFEAFRLGEA